MIRQGSPSVSDKQAKETRFVPFGYKLMISYLLFSLLPVIVFGYLANSILIESTREQTRGNVQAALRQMKDNIEYRMNDMVRLSDLVYFDNAIVTRLRQTEEGWHSYESTTQFILPKLDSLLKATSLQIWLSVYFRNETLAEVYNTYGDSDPLAYAGKTYDIYHWRRIAHKDWYRDLPPEDYGKTIVWRQIERDGEFGHISMLRRIVDTSAVPQLREIGVMRFTVKLSELFSTVYPDFGVGTYMEIKDRSGHSLWTIGNTEAQRAQTSGGGQFLEIAEDIHGGEWKLVARIPKEWIEKDARKVEYLTVAICAVSFLLLLFVGLFLSRYFSRRVSRIVLVLDSFRLGDFRKRIHFKGRDEFSVISQAINSMARHIDELIREVYVTSLKKREAELESLQAQINPHFLYNTLSSISRLAKFGQVEKLHQMVRNLALFYRLSLNEGRTVIPIANELEQAKAYLDIQKIKYGDRMDVLFEIDPDLLRFETVKLILQPFLENVLEHAWCGDWVHIRVTGRRDGDDIEFRIIDDGVGMTPDTLKRVTPGDGRSAEGYGIYNVHERIRLHYGNGYGVSIFSRLGIGTAVTIRIPCVRRSVPYADSAASRGGAEMSPEAS
ncbi:sensor histidine kinase [Paenibacillus thermoaerophilus]|uniref:histidine kinase n=1 Tax=Paenibacillus thermoaerophilus TaxID=1215385 RepID=A0ABW2V8F9_9BACL|nr:sensor histidine kinase [Paenibacillus thermoaerophilus]TMV16175.1 sensor histidine kinase [Paenibacillus thermoaerophilus]